MIERVGSGGIQVDPTGLIDETYNFSEGMFNVGRTSGTFLTVNNAQVLTGAKRINNVNFSSAITGGSNITKPNSTGRVEFYDAQGVFAGERFDSDPNNLVDWLGSVVLTWKATASNSNWFDKNNWSVNIGPDTIPYNEARVIIPPSLISPIIVSGSGVAIAKGIEIKPSATLTLNTNAVNDTDLVINGDLYINGSLTLTSNKNLIDIRGNWTRGATGVFTHNKGTVVVNSTLGTALIDNGTMTFHDLIILHGSVKLMSTTYVENDFITYPTSWFDYNLRHLEVYGNYIIDGTLTVSYNSNLTLKALTGTKTFKPGSAVYNNLYMQAGAIATYVLSSPVFNLSNLVTLSGGTFKLNGNVFNYGFNYLSAINVLNATLDIDGGSVLKMKDASTLSIGSGGVLKLRGNSVSSVASITNQGAGTYTVSVGNGGRIDAKYFSVEYTTNQGLNIMLGATVTNLSDGAFSNGIAGGRFLTLNNNFATTDTLYNISFNSGTLYNVSRTTGANSAIFKNANGLKGGYLYEEDDVNPNTGKIRWIYSYEIATWNGSANTDWENPTNWTCSYGTCSTFPNSDNWFVIVPTTANKPIISAANYTIKELTVTGTGILRLMNNRNLEIKGGVITSGLGEFKVDNGSTSTITVHGQWNSAAKFTAGSSTVVLKGAAGTINLNTNNYPFNNLIVDSTATYQTTSSLDINGNLLIKQGGLIVQNGHLLNIGGDLINDANFVSYATTTTFDGAGNQQVKGGTYANLIIGGGGTKTLTDDVLITNVTVQTGSTLFVDDNTLELKGDLNINQGGILNMGTGTMLVTGSIPQEIILANSPIFYDVVINNTAGEAYRPQVRISEPITIGAGGTMSLLDGILWFITGEDSLEIMSGATIIGGDSTSYVAGGIMNKVGNDMFCFPIGTIDLYAPVCITAPVTPGAKFGAKYYEAYYPQRALCGVRDVSGIEYWDIKRNAGTMADSVKVTLFFNDLDYSDIQDISALVVSHFNGSCWENMGREATGSNWLKSNKYFTHFSPVAPADEDGTNQLPIELLSFDGAYTDGKVELVWVTASEINNDVFIIERSFDGKTFEAVKVIKGAGNSHRTLTYSEWDESPVAGMVYYRLKQVDYDGSYTYSNIIYVSEQETIGDNAFAMYPNPLFGDELTIVLEGYKRNSMVQLDITTAYGKVVLTQQAKVTKDNIMLKDEALEQLAPGVYFVSLRSNDIVKTQTLVVY